MWSIELRHITKRFGKVVAVDDLSLKIDAGSFLTLLGPSGCGKTTVLRMIAGLEEPDAGEILINDRVVYAADTSLYVPPSQRGIGLVFQTYALWPHMTVYQNVAFGLQLAHRPPDQIRARVRQVLSDLQIAGLEERYPQEMSGGQQQRVALARMLAPEPRIFLLDEPLSNLDARLRMDMRSELKRLHRQTGATVIYVTHDQVEALTMSTRVVVMNAGTVQQCAGPDEVYRRPSNLFVADFIGNPKSNLLPATAVSHDGRTLLDFGDFQAPCPVRAREGPVTVGIRPESISLSVVPRPGAVQFQVYSALPAGSELIVNAQRGQTLLTVKETRLESIDMDCPVWLTFAPATFNLYDPVTTQLIREERAAPG